MGFIRDTFFGGAEERAAQTQALAADRAIESTERARAEARADLQPFTGAGSQALPGLVESATGVDAGAREFLDATRDGQGQARGDTELMSEIFRGDGGIGSYIRQGSGGVAGEQSLRNLVNAGPEELNRFIASGGGATDSLSQLREMVGRRGDTGFERKEGFDDILSAARATGKVGGGTFRDLTKYSDDLNRRDEQRRIGNLSNLVGMESDLRGRRLGELLTGRKQGLGELRDLIGVERGGRAQRLAEMLQGRGQRLNELGVAGDTERGARDDEMQRMLTRLGVQQGSDASRFGRLFSLANMGQSSAAGQANVTTNAGSDVAGLQVGQGNALAAGLIGKNARRRGTIFDLASLAYGAG